MSLPGAEVGIVDEAIAGGVARRQRRDGRAQAASPDDVICSVDTSVGVEISGRVGGCGLGFVGAHVESANESLVRRTALIGLTCRGDECGVARVEGRAGGQDRVSRCGTAVVGERPELRIRVQHVADACH